MNAPTPKTDFDTIGQLMERLKEGGINFSWLPEDEKDKGNHLVIDNDLDLDVRIKERMHLTVKGLVSANIDINGCLCIEEHDDSIVVGLKLDDHTIKADTLSMDGCHGVESSGEWYAISGSGSVIIKDYIHLNDVSIQGEKLTVKCRDLHARNIVGDVFINADDEVTVEHAENNDEIVPVILADSIVFTGDGPIGAYRFIATYGIVSHHGFYDGVQCFSLGRIDGENGGHENLNDLNSMFVASSIAGLGDDIVRTISETMPEQYASLSQEIREFVRDSVELIRKHKGVEALDGDQGLMAAINADAARQSGLEKLLPKS